MANFQKTTTMFLSYLLVERNYSPLTVEEYRLDLQLFGTYLKENYQYPEDFPVKAISRYEIANFLADIILIQKNQAAIRNRRLYSLRSFFHYLERQEIIEKNPTLHIDPSKEPFREPIYLRPKEIRSFLQAVDDEESRHRIRDICLVKILLYCGLRVSELTNLDTDNIYLDAPSLSFIGKGNKERYLPLHQEVTGALRSWLSFRLTCKMKNPDARKALFLSNRGTRMTPRTIQYMMKKYAKKAGIRNATKITPHKLRHTFATMVYQKTGDIRLVQDLLGHASISTTQVYSHTDLRQKEMAIHELDF